jgi:ATP-dependent DNA ligase
VQIWRENIAKLTAKLKKLIEPPGFTGDQPGGPSRWSTERSTEWQPLKPELVVEVCYGHFSDGRFRHGTRLLRWRPDKSPEYLREAGWQEHAIRAATAQAGANLCETG